MQFKEFAEKLHDVLSEGNNTSIFARTLFEAIIPEEQLDLLDGVSQNTLKAYYNGRTNISALARKINASVRQELFAKYIKGYGKPVAQKLCDKFAEDIEDINVDNVSKRLAKLFDEIITEAATVKKGQNKDLAKNSNVAEALTINQIDFEKAEGSIVMAQNQDYSEKVKGTAESGEQFINEGISDEEFIRRGKFGNVRNINIAKNVTTFENVETLTLNMN